VAERVGKSDKRSYHDERQLLEDAISGAGDLRVKHRAR
jgi:hypothetical protein